MEELLKLAKRTKEAFPILIWDIDSIVEDCTYQINLGENKDIEIMSAIGNINELVKQLEEYDS